MEISLPLEVLAFETDYGGVVSNTRYLEYLERGRYALLHSAGLYAQDAWDQLGIVMVVRRATVDYLGFARHEEKLTLKAWVTEHTGATTLLSYELTRDCDDAVLLKAEQLLAYLNKAFRPVRVPAQYREGLRL